MQQTQIYLKLVTQLADQLGVISAPTKFSIDSNLYNHSDNVLIIQNVYLLKCEKEIIFNTFVLI